MDLRHVIRLTKPAVRVTHELKEIDPGRLRPVLGAVVARTDLVSTA